MKKRNRRKRSQTIQKRREGTPSPRRGVVLTLRQAKLLLSCAQAWIIKHGLTPDEKWLVGAARRRVEKAKKGNH